MKEEYKGYSIEISQDEYADDPTENYEEDIILCILSKRYRNPAEKKGDRHPVDYWQRWPKRNPKYACYPLWVYDHSGVHYLPTLSDADNPFSGKLPAGHAEFDTARAGFIAVKKSRVRGQVKRFQTARDAVAEYTAYSNGGVYRYTIRDSVGDVVYSCGDYYGLDQARQDAHRFIDNL